MNFASEYVYSKARRPLPPIHSGIVAGGCVMPPPPPPGDDDDEPDTNVVSMTFEQLVDKSKTHVGDPVKCQNCEAYLSKLSKVEKEVSLHGKRKWVCDFCNFENAIVIEDEEMPKDDEVTYILEGSLEPTEVSPDDQYLIYCIDISGSMAVTTEVQGNFTLPTDEIRRAAFTNLTGERPAHSRGVRHISRLEALQVAIEDSLVNMIKTTPNKRVGIVAFNQEVRVIGDGLIDEAFIKGEKLDSKSQIKDLADSTINFGSLNDTKKKLTEKLINLEEGGATALGPALYYSVLMASKKRGSKVILCTDGLANKGLGALDSLQTEIESNAFYQELADLACDNGISVSILTIEGTNCRLGVLGDVCDKTNGTVKVVNPLNLKSEFSSIISEQIIATNVEATFIVHKALYIKDRENIGNKLSFSQKSLGNVTKSTEITLEFGIREDTTINIDSMSELPFQLKIVYNDVDGFKAMRVLTKTKKLTKDRAQAEKNTDRKVLAVHCIQTESNLLQKNKKSSATSNMRRYIKSIQTVQEDEFSENEFERVNNDLENISRVPPAAASGFRSGSILNNAFSEMDDIASSNAYAYKKIGKDRMKKK